MSQTAVDPDLVRRICHNIQVLSKKVQDLERKSSSPPQEKNKEPLPGRKRKRSEESLKIQEMVHTLHNSSDEAMQYIGQQFVTSKHNKSVTSYITHQLEREGFDARAVSKAAKKYHEHLRRKARGKLTEEVARKKKIDLRKERKYELRLRHINPKNRTELQLMQALSKHHMSSDEEVEENNETKWGSRVPSYRSERLQQLLNNVDKEIQHARTQGSLPPCRYERTGGTLVEKEPPVDTPEWAIKCDSDGYADVSGESETDQDDSSDGSADMSGYRKTGLQHDSSGGSANVSGYWEIVSQND